MTVFPKFSLSFLIALGLGAPALPGATVSSTVVSTQPSGAIFYVDGQKFNGPATFMWPQGSKHTLNIDVVQLSQFVKTRYTFTGWSDSTGALTGAAPLVVITADPAITFYQAAVTDQYAVTLSFFPCPSNDPRDCDSPGTVFVNNVPFIWDADAYVDAGSLVTLRAAPNPGWVFTGWLPGFGNGAQAYLNSFTINQPVTVYPQFVRAASVTIASNPPELQVIADNTPVVTPAKLDWAMHTTHTLAAVTPQTDLHGKLWVFDSWSDAGDATHAYTMQAQASVTLTAKYTAGGRVSFTTNPPGLKLAIDGRDNWPGYNFLWGAGQPHTISAPPQQVDANGHGWAFKSWSNGGAALQTLTLNDATVAAGVRLTASFTPSSQTSGQTVIQSVPSGVPIAVDGSPCATPCTIQRNIGSLVQVSAPSTVLVGSDTELLFTRWADGPPADRTITVTGNSQTLTANYQTKYRLACTANPPGAVSWQINPAVAGGFYATGTAVTISILVSGDYRFGGWGGDATGAATTITQIMDRPRSIWPKLARLSSNGIDAVGNAVGDTPEAAVAPGSLISIYGSHLASGLQVGPDSPLAQTLAGVTVTVGNQMLPLLFVSPGQINAQLPYEVAQGAQTIEVHSVGQPDVTGVFTVQPNAPGLFFQQISGRPYLIATHEDGSLVTPQSPAHRGELVTALGTGLGPYQVPPPDGFAAPSSGHYPLLDKVELLFGDKVIEPESAGAAPGRVGITAIRFRIADPLPAASSIEIEARVNGHVSNTVLLTLK